MQAWEEKYYEREEALEEGRMQILGEMVQKKLGKGKSIGQIAEDLEMDEDTIREVIAELQEEEDTEEV